MERKGLLKTIGTAFRDLCLLLGAAREFFTELAKNALLLS